MKRMILALCGCCFVALVVTALFTPQPRVHHQNSAAFGTALSAAVDRLEKGGKAVAGATAVVMNATAPQAVAQVQPTFEPTPACQPTVIGPTCEPVPDCAPTSVFLCPPTSSPTLPTCDPHVVTCDPQGLTCGTGPTCNGQLTCQGTCDPHQATCDGTMTCIAGTPTCDPNSPNCGFTTDPNNPVCHVTASPNQLTCNPLDPSCGVTCNPNDINCHPTTCPPQPTCDPTGATCSGAYTCQFPTCETYDAHKFTCDRTRPECAGAGHTTEPPPYSHTCQGPTCDHSFTCDITADPRSYTCDAANTLCVKPTFNAYVLTCNPMLPECRINNPQHCTSQIYHTCQSGVPECPPVGVKGTTWGQVKEKYKKQ
jgi:hypothetical protein